MAISSAGSLTETAGRSLFRYPPTDTPEHGYTYPMDFDEYEKLASRTALFDESQRLYRLYDLGLGVAGESGELAEKLKKAIRDDGADISDERREALKREIGDVLWYLSQLSRALGIKFSEVAEANIQKLADRYERSALQGEGDNR